MWWSTQPGQNVDAETFRGMSLDEMKRHLLGFHAGWHDPIPRILAAAENIVVTATLDVASLPTWSRGRTLLIGDAAHATSPHAGQGASLALEDAMRLGIETIYQYNSMVPTMSIARNLFIGREPLKWSLFGIGAMDLESMRKQSIRAIANVDLHVRSPDARVGEFLHHLVFLLPGPGAVPVFGQRLDIGALAFDPGLGVGIAVQIDDAHGYFFPILAETVSTITFFATLPNFDSGKSSMISSRSGSL